MDDWIERIGAFVVTIPRDTPYLGPLGAGEEVNARGYFVRKSNRTIYPTQDGSVVVRVITRNCVAGRGETNRELGALREALGPAARLMVDFHWMHGRGDVAPLRLADGAVAIVQPEMGHISIRSSIGTLSCSRDYRRAKPAAIACDTDVRTTR